MNKQLKDVLLGLMIMMVLMAFVYSRSSNDVVDINEGMTLDECQELLGSEGFEYSKLTIGENEFLTQVFKYDEMTIILKFENDELIEFVDKEVIELEKSD